MDGGNRMKDTLRRRMRHMALEHAEAMRPEAFAAQPSPEWHALRQTGTRLWLDTGDMDEAAALWTSEFSGLTTNNTLLNREVQKGAYDKLVADVWRELKGALSPRDAVIEIAFLLNAVHGLRLAARFGCRVSVELHTDLCDDMERSLLYGRRYHEISPDRFIVKIPLTPSGLLAARRLGNEGVPINFTLGFSARQNFLAAALAQPQYVNVFLGRLNSFVADNKLGDGANVGERATLASQSAVEEVNELFGVHVRQIAASMRNGAQIAALAGVDVYTMPPKAAREFLDSAGAARVRSSHLGETPPVTFASGVDVEGLTLNTLHTAPEPFKEAALESARRAMGDWTPDTLCTFFRDKGVHGFLMRWTDEDRRAAKADGRIPKLARWRTRFESGGVALDAVMNLSGLMAFTTDQEAMDARIEGLLD